MPGISRVARRGLTAGIAACAVIVGGAGAALALAPGGAGAGDPYFPDSGNTGYDVGHYDLRLKYDVQRHKLRARTSIAATVDPATPLDSLSLDFRGPKVSSVKVDGAPARFSRAGQELKITPASPLAAGAAFDVVVKYAGRVKPLTDPDGSLEGWVPTDDGAFVVGEPKGSPTWFPCNDVPTDKATYDFRIRVRKGTEAVANGALVGRERKRKHVIWSYSASQPMASYLATATIGDFRLQRAEFDGLRSLVAIDPREARRARGPVSKLKRMTRFFSQLVGPYPFTETGVIVDHAPRVGYALETQTRPIFDSAPSEVTVAHELAHQWFGDFVSLERWKDIWLNEGFATWMEWRWDELAGGPTTATVFKRLERSPASRKDLWDPPPGDPGGPQNLFANSIYIRGGMAVEALRQRIGDDAFYATLRAWVSQHQYGNATTDDFIALSEAQSGQQLDDLFERYLFKPGKP